MIKRQRETSKGVSFVQWTFPFRDGRSSGTNKAESQRIGDLMLKYVDMLQVRYTNETELYVRTKRGEESLFGLEKE